MEISIKAAAEMVKVSRTTIYDKLKSGELAKCNSGKIETSELLRVFGSPTARHTKQEEKEHIEQCWNDGDPNDEFDRSGVAWLYDGAHNWQVDYDSVTIYGPFTVDKIDENVYNEVIETVELKPRPPFVATTAWPFSG